MSSAAILASGVAWTLIAMLGAVAAAATLGAGYVALAAATAAGSVVLGRARSTPPRPV